MENVVIIGATEKEGRYARMAQELLTQHGHRVFPIARKSGIILGAASYQGIEDILETIDTVTIYVRPEHLTPFVQPIIQKGVKRVIMNPGTESEAIKNEMESAGIEVLEACTLVMLRTGQF
jgi:uncharacterized protein